MASERLTVLSLFAGIGGFDLGLERTGGFRTIAFCEIEPFQRAVLRKHWPGVFIHDDIRTLTKDTLCKGYAENALLNLLCREMGGSSASVRDAITRIRKHAEQKTRRATMSELPSAEEALSTIMEENAPAAEKASTHFWRSIINTIMAVTSGPDTRELCGSSLSREDFLTIIKFFVTTATWQSPSTVPAPIREILGVDRYERLEADGLARPDVICGGFPCQDVSLAAGRTSRAGIDGARSGLWTEFARIVAEIGPRWVIAENSPALRVRGADKVLSDLEAIGYSFWSGVVGAVHAGADHWRKRAWIVAYRAVPGLEVVCESEAAEFAPAIGVAGWATEPGVGRVAYGVPNRMDRIEAIGNAVVPAIPELIGRAILRAEGLETRHAA